MAHVSDYKKKTVKEFSDLIKEYPIVGALDMENLSALQLQKMRQQLRGKVLIKMTKRRLLKYAFDAIKKDKKNIEQLVPHLKGMPAVLFTKENPFSLYKKIEKSKSKAPAKPGQKAPNDIVVPAGPTPFAPGPIISELGSVKIKAGIDKGKVVIKEDSLVAKEGDVINDTLASVLSRLGITPMEVGLNLTAVYEDGDIYTKDVLAIDEEEYVNNVAKAHSWSLNLAVFAGIPSKDTIELLLAKAFNDSKALALSENILADIVVEQLVGKAEAGAKSLAAQSKFDVQAKKSEVEEEKPEKPKPEEKKVEEVKPETPKPAEKVEELKPEIKEEPVKEPPKAEKKEEPEPEIKPEQPKPDVPESKKEEKPQKQPEPKPVKQEKPAEEVDKAVEDMVEQAKKFSKGEKKPTADELLEEVKEEEKPEEPKEEVKKEPERVPTAAELAAKKQKEK